MSTKTYPSLYGQVTIPSNEHPVFAGIFLTDSLCGGPKDSYPLSESGHPLLKWSQTGDAISLTASISVRDKQLYEAEKDIGKRFFTASYIADTNSMKILIQTNRGLSCPSINEVSIPLFDTIRNTSDDRPVIYYTHDTDKEYKRAHACFRVEMHVEMIKEKPGVHWETFGSTMKATTIEYARTEEEIEKIKKNNEKFNTYDDSEMHAMTQNRYCDDTKMDLCEYYRVPNEAELKRQNEFEQSLNMKKSENKVGVQSMGGAGAGKFQW